MKVFFIIFLCLNSALNVVTASCSDHWTAHKGKCYFMHNSEAKFDKEQNYCTSLNESIISIQSSEEKQFIVSLLEKHNVTCIWLNSKQMKKQGLTLEWLGSSLSNYNSWLKGEADEFKNRYS
ncbi:perlucin-like protein isoform A, partial [Leptotrombidium deliense]